MSIVCLQSFSHAVATCRYLVPCPGPSKCLAKGASARFAARRAAAAAAGALARPGVVAASPDSRTKPASGPRSTREFTLAFGLPCVVVILGVACRPMWLFTRLGRLKPSVFEPSRIRYGGDEQISAKTNCRWASSKVLMCLKPW